MDWEVLARLPKGAKLAKSEGPLHPGTLPQYPVPSETHGYPAFASPGSAGTARRLPESPSLDPTPSDPGPATQLSLTLG